jgi:hypothetical protein
MTTRALPPCELGLDGETLSTWRDGLLRADESRHIARHTPTCASCQRELGDFETITSLLNGQRAPSLRAEVWDGVRRRIMDNRQRRFFIGSGRIWGSAAAAIVVIALVGLFAALLARGPLGGPPGSGTPGPTTTPCQTPTPFTGPTPTVTPFSAQTPTPGGTPGGTPGSTASPRPCLPTPLPGTTPTPTPAQANAYEQLGWTAPPGVKQGLVPRAVFAASKPNVGYACTTGPNGETQISKTTDGGATWTYLSSPIRATFCFVTVNPTNPNDVLVNDGSPFNNTIVRSKDGGVTWQKQNAGTLAFQKWGWAGSTLLVGTILTESQESLTALYKSVNGGPFVEVDQQGKLAGVKLGLPSFVGGTASQLYVQSGIVQLSDPVSVQEETFTSHDDGATWQKATFAGGAVHLIDATADWRALIGLASDDLTRVEVSLDAGQTWRKLPVKPSDVSGFGALYMAPDGSVIATSQRLGMVDRPDNRVFLARPSATQWSVAATLPPNSALETIQWDASGHPIALWADYATDDRGSAWFLLSHPLS